MDRVKRPVRTRMKFLMLPHDLLLNCLARISRSYYPTLSLVSKRFRALIASIELYETRTLLGCTESCLYVFVRFPKDSNPTRLFTLCRRTPVQIIKRRVIDLPMLGCSWCPFTKKEVKKPTHNCMVSIPTRNSFDMNRWNFIVADYKIYKIGGVTNGLNSSEVFFMDCRSHTWHEARRMRVARKDPRMRVLDGKIYVAGKYRSNDLNPSNLNLIECFDPETQIWEHVPSPDVEIGMTYILKSLVMGGKLYLFGNKCVVYKPKENRWDEVGSVGLMNHMGDGWDHDSACVVNNVLYCCKWSRHLQWYDVEGGFWRTLKGVEKLRELPHGRNCAKLVDRDGKLVVLWEEDVDEKEKNIWCAEILLERRNKHEIYGKVVWCDFVLTVPKSCSVLKLLAVTV